MLKTLLTIGSLAGMLSLTSLGNAQALPTAVARGGGLQVGAGISYAMPDYGQKNITGISGFADFDLSQHIGIEADVHYISINTPTDLGENSYLFGPRFIYNHNRFSLYAKGLAGIGNINIQEIQDNPEGGAGNYFAYAFGGGLDIRATRRIVIRAIDVESQHWSYQTGLTPTVYTVGAAYRFR